jgi:hypothetical protein
MVEHMTANVIAARRQIGPVIHDTRSRTRRKRAWMSAQVQEPGLSFWISELTEAFFLFAREARKLERLTRKMRSPLSSEGYNYLLEQQMERVRDTFVHYRKTREEAFAYIKTHYWRSRLFECRRAMRQPETTTMERVVRAS